METTLDRFGRVVIPKSVRDHLGLCPGTVLIVEERGKAVTLTPMTAADTLTDQGGVLVFQCRSVGDLTATVDEVRENRSVDLLAGSVR